MFDRFLSKTEVSKENILTELSNDFRSWHRIFQEINKYAEKNSNNKLIILFDEIQWLAKKNSGFISELKQAWVDWQKSERIKVIICGSSNKFFAKETSGSNDILRGIKTSASIWVNELTLREVEKYYLSNWTRSEICLTYMMLGGSPYYLETIDPEKRFIHAINDAIFTSDSIFLEEINQVLKLEFNASGLNTAKKILRTLGQNGATFSMIAKNTGIPLSTLSHAIDNLLEYEIIFPKELLPRKKYVKETHFYMQDFYLNFYFQILEKFTGVIKNNPDQLIFTSKVLNSGSGFYIPNFSGLAFELLCKRILLRRNIHTPLKNKLLLKSFDYEVGSYQDRSRQIDLIVEDETDRIARIIECKWIDSSNNIHEYVKHLNNIDYPAARNYHVKRFLLQASHVSNLQSEKIRIKEIELLGLDDLFELEDS